ncbi:MAG: FAD-dependent oxidoreductase, partial [Actinomycetota bacterium]
MVADVLVVGAGLAGLRCAVALTELGREVVVLEASDVVGGRVRTDVVNGFQCDRGFQVLNPAYPAVRRWVDVDALALQSFGAGVMVRRDDGLRVVADPFREPRLLPQTLRSGYLRPGELTALGRWAARILVNPRAVVRAPDMTLAQSLDAAGVVGRIRQEILDP